MNPEHTDIWRACGYQHTCVGKSPDLAWHELEIKTFILGGLSHGVTPWHSTIEGPVELTARIHADVAKRERYFSRDYVANVAVLCSQNTHDFFGHIPDTNNLTDYRDGLLGTWMLLTENHIPFEFVFDNQVENGIPEKYQTLILPNAAALSAAAIQQLEDWVRAGGHLIATAQTGQFDEWAKQLPESRLKLLFKIDTSTASARKDFGKGHFTWFAADPGLAYCRSRNKEEAGHLLAAIRRESLPLTVKGPPSLVVNMFRSPDSKELWLHLLNVSHLMPGGDSGFRGLDRPPLKRETKRIGEPLAAARNVALTIHNVPIESASLVVKDTPLTVDTDGSLVIPSIELHDVLVLKLKHEK
jgi:hypothetical protein